MHALAGTICQVQKVRIAGVPISLLNTLKDHLMRLAGKSTPPSCESLCGTKKRSDMMASMLYVHSTSDMRALMR